MNAICIKNPACDENTLGWSTCRLTSLTGLYKPKKAGQVGVNQTLNNHDVVANIAVFHTAARGSIPRDGS